MFDKLTKEVFTRVFNLVQTDVHETAKSKGWWSVDLTIGDMMALLHSEVSEAFEASRHGNPPDDKIPKFSGIEAELADLVIRVMVISQGLELNVAEAIAPRPSLTRIALIDTVAKSCNG